MSAKDGNRPCWYKAHVILIKFVKKLMITSVSRWEFKFAFFSELMFVEQLFN